MKILLIISVKQGLHLLSRYNFNMFSNRNSFCKNNSPLVLEKLLLSKGMVTLKYLDTVDVIDTNLIRNTQVLLQTLKNYTIIMQLS